MQHLNQGRTRKSVHMLGQNDPLPSKTVQKDRVPYRTIKSYIKPITTWQKQLILS